MSELCLLDEAEILQCEIFNAIVRLEQLGAGVLDDLVLCRDISRIRGTAVEAFADMSRQADLKTIGVIITQVYDEVTGLQDRVIAAMEGTAFRLRCEIAGASSEDQMH